MKIFGVLGISILCCAIGVAREAGRVEISGVEPTRRTEHILSGHLTELNGKYKLRVSEITYQRGGSVGEHHHAGPGFRMVTTGELTYMEGGRTTVYKAGDIFFEPGDMTHTAQNKTNALLKVLNFEILPADWQGSSIIPPR